MTQDMLEKTMFAASKRVPDDGIRLVKSKYYISVAECTFNMHVGLFFDGTNNNYDRDKKEFGHTNVARLSDAYLDSPDEGLYRIYVPGVGTIFPEIGELEESPKKGGGLGWGCEQRILFGLLAVLDSIHRRAFGINNRMFTRDQVRILCTRSTVRDEQELAILRPLGMAQGLMTNDTPQMLLKHLVRQLADKLNAPANKVKVGECMIDIFGFSRGAAQARVFCNWLQQILSGGKLAGVIVQIRFVGLFDTVASYGETTGLVVDNIFNVTDGHQGWAKPESLHMPAGAHYCVHLVAMHEFRKNFPLDTLAIRRQLPPNCREFAYPGAHSDVGGGYRPGELGVAGGETQIEGDALKLSQIPLNHMFECAVAANVPMKKEFAIDPQVDYNPFTINPLVEQAYADFLVASGNAPRFLHEWAQPYLTWRWKMRNDYEQLQQVRSAVGDHRDLMRESNQLFIRDATFINDAPEKSIAYFSVGQEDSEKYQKLTGGGVFDPEAPKILDLVQKNAPSLPHSLGRFFDEFVHDSYAGFSKSRREPTGYWRYRKGFEGDNVPLISRKGPENTRLIG